MAAKLYILLTISSLWGIAAYAQGITLTDQEKAFIREHPVVVFGGDPEWEPMVIQKTGGMVTGYEQDMLQEISRITGLGFELKAGVWEDMVRQAKSRLIDGLVYSSRLPEREPYFLFSIPYNQFKVGFYSAADKTGIDLPGKSVGVQVSDQFSNNYLDRLSMVSKKTYNTRSEMVQALLTGEVDFIFGAMDISYFLWKNSIPGVKLAHLPQDAGFGALYSIRKDWPELVSILNKAIEAIGEQRRLEIMEKWLMLGNGSGDFLSEAELKYLRQHDTLHLVTIQKWMPIVQVDATSRLGGWLGDYFRLVNEQVGFEVMAVGTGDSAVIDSMMALPNTVFIYPDFHYKKAGLVYSEPILSIPYGLAMRRGSPFFNDVRSLGRIKVGVLSYNPHLKEIAAAYPNLEIIRLSNSANGFDRILSGELDGYIGSISTLNYHIQALGYSELFIASLVDFSTTLHFSSMEPALIQILDKAMIRVPEAEKQRFIKNWYGARSFTKVDKRLAYQIGVGSFLVLLVLVGWVYSLRRLIAKRKVVEAHLKENQARLMALIENSEALIYSLDTDLRIIAKNSAFERFMEHFTTLPIRLGDSLVGFIPDEFREKWTGRYRRALAGERYTVEDSAVFHDSQRNFITHFNPIEVGGKVVGISCLTEDVTQFTRLNKYMISLMDASYDYLFIKGKDRRYVVASQSMAEVNGLASWHDMVGKTDEEIHPVNAHEPYPDETRVLEEGLHSINKVHSFLDKDGEMRWVQTTNEPIHNQQGDIIGLAGVSRDITEQRKAEQEQQLLISIIENSQDFISFVNADLEFIYMNKAGLDLLGLDSYQGVLLNEIMDAVTFKVLKNGLKHKVGKGLAWNEEFEVLHQRTGAAISMDHHILAVYDQEDQVVCYGNIARDVTERNKLQEQIIEAKLDHELMHATLKVEDSERNRLAHELHDGIQQQIAAVSIYLQSLDSQGRSIDQVIQNSIAKLNDVIGEIRGISHSLMPRGLKSLGLTATLHDEMQKLAGGRMSFQFHENLGAVRFSAEVELNLYRIFQESITNIMKHSQASQVLVQLILSGHMLSLIIEDDGKGFDVTLDDDFGLGLASIQNRAGVLGGHVEIHSAPDEGTSILVEVQVKAK